MRVLCLGGGPAGLYFAIFMKLTRSQRISHENLRLRDGEWLRSAEDWFQRHVNSILMAGRADLVCLGRPHLADPYWTLHAAIALGDTDSPWPLPYLPGREQAVRLAERAQETIRA